MKKKNKRQYENMGFGVKLCWYFFADVLEKVRVRGRGLGLGLGLSPSGGKMRPMLR